MFEEEHHYDKKSSNQKINERRPLPFKLVAVTAEDSQSMVSDDEGSMLTAGQAVGAVHFVPILRDLRQNALGGE